MAGNIVKQKARNGIGVVGVVGDTRSSDYQISLCLTCSALETKVSHGTTRVTECWRGCRSRQIRSPLFCFCPIYQILCRRCGNHPQLPAPGRTWSSAPVPDNDRHASRLQRSAELVLCHRARHKQASSGGSTASHKQTESQLGALAFPCTERRLLEPSPSFPA